MCCEPAPLDTSTKVRFMLEQALLRAARHKGLYWGHIQLGGPPSCAGGDTFMTTYPERCPHYKWGKNSHNSPWDINDLWHLGWKSLQSHSAADLQGGIAAGWIMPNMKGTKLRFKISLKLLVCNINLWVGSMTKKHCLPLCTSVQKFIVPTQSRATCGLQRAVCSREWWQTITTHGNSSWICYWELSVRSRRGNHRGGPEPSCHRLWHSWSSNYEWHQANCCNLCC